MTWSRLLRFAKGIAVKRKVNAEKRIASQTVKLVNQRVTLADPRPIAQRHARPKGIVNRKPIVSRKVIANRKPVVTVIDVRQKGDAHRKETDVVRVAMLLVVRPMAVVQAMVNGAVSCRGSLKSSTAITMARSAAMNWIA